VQLQVRPARVGSAESFVIRVIYISAAPEIDVKLVSDSSNLRHFPFSR
jgi:hypothetical protein